MDFLVAQDPSEIINYDKEDVLFVDGSIPGYKAYDHHKTGERINLDAMPRVIEDIPKAVVTTQIDTDAICSAVVVYFGGESNLDPMYTRVFRTASTYCDYLIPNPDFDKDTNTKGLGMHLYLKETGVKSLSKYKKVTYKERSTVFKRLSEMLIDVIKKGDDLPNDTSYLNRIDSQVRLVKDSMIHVDDLISVIYAKEFIDPIASYKVVNTPLLVTKSNYARGLYKYGIGVNPKYYGEYNIKPLLTHINDSIEPGWGGRNIAGGSPFKGTTMSIEQLIDIIHQNKNLIII